MTDVFQSKQAFLDAFNINAPYYDPTLLNDVKFGFSVKRKYPENFGFNGTADSRGVVNDFAVIWVVLRESLPKKNGSYPVTVRVSNIRSFSSEESIETRKSRPLELQYNHDFFYNPNKQIFVDDNGKVISAKSIIDLTYKEHCDTIHPIRGFELKLKKTIRGIAAKMLLFVIIALKFIIEKIYNIKLRHTDKWINMLPLSLNTHGFEKPNPNAPEEIQKDKPEFAGYKGASRESIIIFCFTAIILSLAHYYKFYESQYLRRVISDNFLTITHSILFLAVIEALPHKILFPILNFLMKLRGKIFYASLDPFTYKRWIKRFVRAVPHTIALTTTALALASIIIRII